jgi:Zn-dependent protease
MNIDWLRILTLVPVLVFSMTLHELAHGWVAYRLGDPTAKLRGRLSFNPLKHLDPIGTLMFFITAAIPGSFIFGWAKPVPVSPYYFKSRQRGMMWVGMAGPATNFLLAVVFGVVLNLLAPVLNKSGVITDYVFGNGTTLPVPWVFSLLFLALQVNIILGIFNLIPIPPLDGSRIVGGLLPRSAYERWVAIDRYGMIIIIVLLVLLSYGGLGGLIGRGEYGLLRAVIPAYR